VHHQKTCGTPTLWYFCCRTWSTNSSRAVGSRNCWEGTPACRVSYRRMFTCVLWIPPASITPWKALRWGPPVE
jgi:hypothetical protein